MTNEDAQNENGGILNSHSYGFIIIFAPIAYVLSVGPVVWVYFKTGWISTKFIEVFYWPLDWLHRNTVLKEPLDWYINLFK